METQNKLAVTVKEGANSIGISQSKMYQLIAGRQINVIKIGRSTRIRVAELERFLNSLEQEVR